MNEEHKERLFKLLTEYCAENDCMFNGDKCLCDKNYRLECGIDYCPILYIRKRIRKECYL